MEGTTRPYAVVTGASSGIGFELARVLGSEGFDLMITAEDRELEDAERELSSVTEVDCVKVDLAEGEGVERLHREIKQAGRPVDVLVLNAGIGAGGAFVGGTDLEDELKLIDLNVRSTVQLCKLEADEMVSRHEGRILFTSSEASTIPGPYQAVYNASKSFVQSFALALRNELKDTGVSVTSLMPGRRRPSSLNGQTWKTPRSAPRRRMIQPWSRVKDSTR
jgi:short-subunit dehydrogenase